jgi:hypothetical protein
VSPWWKKKSTLWGLQPSVGPFGKHGISFALRANLSKILISIVCYVCALMSYWAGLYLVEDKEALMTGVNTTMQIAMKLLNKKSKPDKVQLLEDGSDNGQED